MKKNIELLAPAGNIESFKAAVNAGADAVYMGLGKHNARVMAKNFTTEDYIDCLNYAHIRGVKVYLTLNTLVQDDEIKEAMEELITLYEHGLDAVILQDLGLVYIIHKILPNLAMHASTQMSAYSLEQVKYFESLGFKRVVLARELSLKEIKYITDNTNVEIEAFVHGALCVCVSGQCLLSLSIGNRSANRGACAQPCRMRYTLAKRDGIVEKNTYILSKKDIFGLDVLKDIIEANISSLKIEGRNKTPEYVALVVSMYRKYIDKYLKGEDITISEDDEKKIIQIFNRSGKSHGYLKGTEYKNSITPLTPKNTGLYLGKVIDKKGKFVKLKLEEEINIHDGVEIYSKNNISSTIVTCIKDNKGKIVNKLQEKGTEVYLGDFNNSNFEIGDFIYKTSNNQLNQEIAKRYLKVENRNRGFVLNVDIKKDAPVTLSVIINNQMYTFNTNIIPEVAISKELTLDDLNIAFSKTQNTGILFTKTVGYIEKGLFLRTSTLNEIRRNLVSKLQEKYFIHNDVLEIREKLEKELDIELQTPKKDNIKEIMSLYRYDSSNKYDEIYYKKYNKKLQRIDFQVVDYIKNKEDILSKYLKYDIGIVIPNVTFESTHNLILEKLDEIIDSGVKYVILGSFRYINILRKYKEKYDFKIIADYSFNICNSYAAKFMKEQGFDIITPAFDATEEQINKLSNVVPIELVDNFIEVMTSRYCIIGSFVANRNEKCSAPCLKDKYYLIDSYNEKYDILCNNLDCTMKIIKKNKLNKKGKYNTRRNEL